MLTLNGKKIVGGYMDAGAAAAPGLAFALDPDSGLYWISADKIALISGGTAGQGITIDNTGQVGIGTTAPAAPLDVWDGSIALLVGADAAARTRTDATTKHGRIAAAHATNAEEPVSMIGVYANVAGFQTVQIGGGSASENACTGIQLYTAADNTTVTGTPRMTFDAAGGVYINESTNAFMGYGLTINQDALDNEIMAFKSSDVAHALTTGYEADTYGTIQKAEAAAGGLKITGLKDADGVAGHAVHVLGILDEATADTTKSAAGIGVVTIDATLEGTNVPAVCGADENLVVMRNLTTTRFIFDAEGEMHSDAVIGAGDDWDQWDDLALAADLSRLPKAKFDEMMRYQAEDFERAGLLTLSTDEDGTRHAFLKNKALHQFAMCCFAQVGQKLATYEAAFASLGVDPAQLLTAGKAPAPRRAT
ncbi:hypothetical protein ACFLWA_12620 [Chloroflexota bacterium]